MRADNSSAGKDYGGSSNDKIGNADLKWAFSEVGMAMLRSCAPVTLWHQKQAQEHGKTGAHARLRHKLALTVYSMLKHDKVFDLEKFVGKKCIEEAEQAKAGHKNPPRESNGAAVIAEATPRAEVQSKAIVDVSHLVEESKAAAKSATEKKRGRPALPRDPQGMIIRSSPKLTTEDNGPASATHQRKEDAGPNSKPSLTTAPPAPSLLTSANVQSGPRRGRPPLPRDSQGHVLRPASTPALPCLTDAPRTISQTTQEAPLQHILQERLAGFSQADLSNLLLSIVSNITTGAANPAHNWSSLGPDSSRLPSRLIGAAPVASPVLARP